jgi:hypothetical protein
VTRVGDTIVCRQHGRRPTTCDDLICGRHCGCRRKNTTTEFHPAPKEDEPEDRVGCKTCGAYDIPLKENMELYRTWGFVCSDCADGILARK